MAKKPKAKAKEAATDEDAGAKPRGSRKLLLAAALMCLLSLGGGFFLARMAYMQDAEAYAPDYKSEEEDHGDGQGDDHAEAKDDGHGGEKKTTLRTDITDPLAKDGHDAEKAYALQAKEDEYGGDKGDVLDTGLLNFGDMMTNIQSFDAQGSEKTAFLKINLVVAYRPDEGSGALMEEREPFMRDLFNGYLRGLSEADVRGMAGILYIKGELLKRARAAVGSDLPQEILINDLIVQ